MDGIITTRWRDYGEEEREEMKAILIIMIILLSIIPASAHHAGDGSLRPYQVDKSREFWMPDNPSSYIIPNNPIVQAYADRLYVDTDGSIRYKNEYQVWWTDVDGNDVYKNKRFSNNYTYSFVQFGSGNMVAGGDNYYPVNADYYLTHGLKGVCGDSAYALTSMLLSGNMSIIVNGSYVPMVVDSVVLVGYADKGRHAWVEYNVYGDVYSYSVSPVASMVIHGDTGYYTWYRVTDEVFEVIV